MIRIENTDVYGFQAAIRGMRNPMNSWDKSDSWFGCHEYVFPKGEVCKCTCFDCEWIVGENDLDLMQRLSKAGNDHGKYLRFIDVTCDITAPLYWWKEFDTYKVGTVANSCSTMHKIHAKEFTLDDFSYEHLSDKSLEWLRLTIIYMNDYRNAYLKTKEKQYWWKMIQTLPSSYNQKRTLQLNYQVLKSMYHARKNHKLDEWREFCRWCEELPYFKEICIDPCVKEVTE